MYLCRTATGNIFCSTIKREFIKSFFSTDFNTRGSGSNIQFWIMTRRDYNEMEFL